MQSKATTVDEYLKALPADRQQAMTKIRKTILKNLPKGFKETMGYGMISYVVPLSIYPDGYHCNPKQPLTFMCLASQKNAISLHHMGVYGDPALLKWFTTEYAKQCKTKLDMGKGCVRFKKPDDIPYTLIADLVNKVSVQDWINHYEKILASSKTRTKK